MILTELDSVCTDRTAFCWNLQRHRTQIARCLLDAVKRHPTRFCALGAAKWRPFRNGWNCSNDDVLTR